MEFGKWIDFNAMALTDQKGPDNGSRESLPASPDGLPGGWHLGEGDLKPQMTEWETNAPKLVSDLDKTEI